MATPAPGSGLDASVRRRVDLRLERFVEARAAELVAVSPHLAPLAAVLRRSMRGGKRLRAAFCWQGWRGAGGAGDSEAVVGLAAALELFHVAALVHDDVMDRSAMRRGIPAAHQAMAEQHRKVGLVGDSVRHGHEAAILMGDLCLTWSDQLLTDSLADSPFRDAGHAVFDLMRTQVIAGQYLDLLETARPVHTSDQENVRAVLVFKSAKYTVEHPLVMGGVMAGASDDLQESYAGFGLPVGEAFQLRDDLLGVFGDPDRTGKPVDDDLREGKHTLLMSFAAERASEAQQRVLNEHLGSPGLDATEADAVREVLVATGARARVEDRIAELQLTAHRRLERLRLLGVPADVRVALGTLADLAVRRDA
ncbi:MAG: polyprenyl synthetase family protein [Nocardioidaceae bacterium]